MVQLGEVNPPIWDTIIEEFTARLEDFEEDDLLQAAENWRRQANRRKFDRELFARYGFMKDLILHPRFQSAKHFLEEHATFDLLVGDPLLPVSTAVILLFMLHRRVKNDVLVLAGLFIFNINPFYVCIGALMVWLFTISSKPKQHKRIIRGGTSIPPAIDIDQGSETKAAQLTADNAPISERDAEYDHVLVGNDIGTLYTAALLSKNGHRCCVLQLSHCAATEAYPPGAPCAAPLLNVSVGKIERYQSLLDVVLSDGCERVKFSPVGGEGDGYTSALIRTLYRTTTAAANPHLSSNKSTAKRSSLCTSLRVGEQSLALDLCSIMPVDKSVLATLLDRFRGTVQRLLTSYLISKVVPWAVLEPSSLRKSDAFKEFADLSSSPLEHLLHSGNGFDLNNNSSELKEVLGSIASIAADEALPPSDCSGYMLAHALTSSVEGSFYPAGGSAAIEASLVRTVLRANGSVYRDVDLKEILLEEVDSSSSSTGGIRAVGVSVAIHGRSSEVAFRGSRSVVSGLGLLPSLTKLLPPEAVSLGLQQTIAPLQACRPKVSVVYWLRGSREEDLAAICSTDYYELGVSRDYYDSMDNYNYDRFADSYVHLWSPSAKDSAWKHKDVQVLIVEFFLTEPFVGSKEVVFSASREGASLQPGGGAAQLKGPPVEGPAVFFSCNKADAHTDPSSSHYINNFNAEVTLSKSKRDRFQQRADAVLRSVYPEVVSRVEIVHVCPSTLSPYLSCTAAKFGCKISSTTEIANFFLTGRDLATTGLAGDLQGGWVAANAILGYSLPDMLASRNVVSDLAKLQ